ncbi:MAG: hypothetical protein K8R67_04240 [Desulfobacteraceae bacterium]|nr:hypothetical protein [Desulfobacteraceae bacterium]
MATAVRIADDLAKEASTFSKIASELSKQADELPKLKGLFAGLKKYI